MRILTVNVLGIIGSKSSTLLDANVFQDYDVLVINPENLDVLWGYGNINYSNHENNWLTSEAGQSLSSLNNKRSKEVTGLLKLGGVIVCFMQPLINYNYRYYYQGKERQSKVTNYDWLPEDIYNKSGVINFGRGQAIDYLDSGHPFSEYLKIKPLWSAYIEKEDCRNWRILASAYETNVLALTKRVELGHIIFLPSYYDYHNGELLKRCITKLIGEKEITPKPNWVKTITVPGQEELISNIKQINEQVNALEKQREAFIDSNNQLERWKYLLYEKGKHQLEPVVREALTLIDCDIEIQPDQDSDGLVNCTYGSALVEVVGSKGTIKIEKFGELTKNIGNYISEKESAVGGILIGNPFCEEPLDNRPPKGSQKDLFAKELIGSAERQGITVLLSTDLYQIVCGILTGKLNEEGKKSIQEKMFKGKGLVRLV